MDVPPLLWMMIPLAYMLGSIPTAVWVGKWFYSIDIRDHGSGNAGATNALRILGPKAGIPVLLFDMLKGWLAVSLFHLQNESLSGTEAENLILIGLGLLAVIGHIFPVFAGFRGGKGVATIAGVCIAIVPAATGLSLMVFIIVLLATKYVSLGSITAGISFPFWTIFVINEASVSLWVFSVLASVLLVLTHRKNIIRLIRGEERKAGFLVKKG